MTTSETAGYIRGFEAYEDDDARKNPNPEAYRDAWSARGHLNISRDWGRRLSLKPYWRSNV